MTTDYPWYDSHWLRSYVRVKAYLHEHRPDRLEEFTRAFDVLRTDRRFEAKYVDDLLAPPDHVALKELIAGLRKDEIELHETLRFGRTVVHDAALCTRLQSQLVERMSELVGEAVEPRYNFLSLYNNLGVCRAHLDAPSAKWTLDYCIEQSGPWPIYLSQTRTWPEAHGYYGDDWEDAIKRDPENRFRAFELREGQALVFAGSSQWHYRERIPRRAEHNFCHLLFFHFVPKGAAELISVDRWPERFGMPELAQVVVPELTVDTSKLR